MTDNQATVLAGIVMIVALVWAATYILKRAYQAAESIKNSKIGRKVKTSAQKAISKSSEGLGSAARAGAALATNISKTDPNRRYEALSRLKQLLDTDAITADEYEIEKRKLLDSQ